MAILEGFSIRNFGVLREVTLGRILDHRIEPLTPMTAVIGKNGSGKSVLFDAFGFLADALKFDVETACDTRERGGFEKIRSQGITGAIGFYVRYREYENAPPITYQIAIDADGTSGRPFVLFELLKEGESGQELGDPMSFLMLVNSSGVVWKGKQEGYKINDIQDALKSINRTKDIKIEFQEGEQVNSKIKDFEPQFNLALQDALKSLIKTGSSEAEIVELDDPRKLGIATLGALKQHPRISAFRRFIEGWYLSYFNPDAARSLPLAGPQEQLNTQGDNLCNVVQFMEREHPQRFQTILNKIAEKIPGINRIDTEKTRDGRLLLRFNEKGFQDPFYAQQMSDGTLKVFAYLLMLENPIPPPFVCIEEPENGLYHKLLETLAHEFREYASVKERGSQVFITTHQPYFIDALDPKEVWILEKSEDGFSKIHSASKDPLVNNLVEEGLRLGGLWYSDYIDPR